MNHLRLVAVALAGLLGAASLAHAAPPPPPGAFPPPPPPPPGAHVILDRQTDGVVHVDVHCAERDTTSACADIASRLLAQPATAPAGK